MVTVFLLVTGIVYSCYCGGQSIPHQERQSRLIPNYEPFQHPAKKVLSTPTSIPLTGLKTSGIHMSAKCLLINEIVGSSFKLSLKR